VKLFSFFLLAVHVPYSSLVSAKCPICRWSHTHIVLFEYPWCIADWPARSGDDYQLLYAEQRLKWPRVFCKSKRRM
jgi:hypothetical protein